MEKKRSDRVADEIKFEMSEILRRNIKDPRIGFVTITRVMVSNDLKKSDIYFSILGTPEQKRSAFEGLMHAKSFLRRELAQRLRIKAIPALRFFLDEGISQVDRIDFLLHQIKQGQNDE